uniref:Uncharacterized protein n=1 Tax=Cyprinus carpio TaxID=7962 RepID=A0A8C1ZX34_CYPCA
MTSEDPLILHVYFLPLFDTFSKEKIKQEETAYNPHVLEIEHPSPSMKIQIDTPHILKVSGASVDSKEGITFLSSIHPVFFKIKQDVDGDVQMTLIKQQHEMFVWKTIIWKDKLNQKKQEMRDLMARFGRLSTEMRKHKKRKPRKGWSDIILHYKASVIDKCKFVTEWNLPTDECMELAGRYTEPVIIQRSKEQNEKYYHEHVRSAHASGLNTSSHLLSNDKNRSIRIDQLFSPDCDGNTPKTVILSGDSGRGKSFTLQKIMLDWAFGKLYYKNFDVIFLLKCEELKCIFEEMSLFELLSWSCSLTSDHILQILELTSEKVLFLIDGIDEYVSHPPSHSMLVLTNPSDRARPMDILRSVLKGILLPESFMLVTTRSLAADAVMNLLKGPQRFTEIVGFSERGVQEYFQKFFQDEQLFRKTYERVKINESLLTACSVPLLCWMVCFCLKKHFTDDDHVMRKLKTNTSIYVHFVSTLLEHHDQSQSVLTMLRSLGQRAEEGVKKREGLFVEKSVTATGLDPATNVFLYKDSLKRNNRQVPVFKFMHLSFQEFFTALYYVLLDKKESWGKVTDLLTSLKMKGIINRPSPERRSNPIPSVMMFLCGLLNEKASNSLFEMIKWTVPQIINLKTILQGSLLTVIRHNGCELFVLRCLFELQDEKVVRRALGDWVSMNLHNVPLRSTDCWVLLYCLQCCPHVRYLNLMYCDLTAEKLKILQPALCMCENMRLTVDYLYNVGDLIQILGESKILRKLKVQEDEYSAESLIWSLDLSVTHEDVLLSLSSSEKNPSFPAVLNITLTCPQSEISSTDWTLFLQRLSKTEKVAKVSSALDEHVSLLLSSFHSVGLKTLDLKLVVLNESWASGIISLVQTCTSLQQLSVEEEIYNDESLFSSLSVLLCDKDIRLDVRHRQMFESLSHISLTCPCSALTNSDWKIFFQTFHKQTKYKPDSPDCNEQADALFSFLHSVCDLKSVELIVFKLNQSWALRILALIQACSSLQEIRVSVTGLLLEEGLVSLKKSLTDPHCTVIIEGRKCSKLTDQCKEQDWSHSCNEKVEIHFKPNILRGLEELNISKLSGLNLQPLPVCQSCVHIGDSDQWVQVEPSVCTDEGGSEFRISTPAGRFECSRTRMRWVCAGDVTLQYRAVDGGFLSEELERLQCERIGPVIDVTVISGKLEEAHLPHYACLAESDPSLRDTVKLFTKRDEGISLQSVELSRYHAKIVQPSFSLTTLIISWFIKWEEHCNLLLYMRCKDPLILHIYFFPVNDTCSKDKVEQNEKSSLLISHPRPNRPFRLKTPHLLEVPGASVHPIEGISFRTDIDPNFFKVKQHQHDDVKMNLIREEDRKSVWKATIWKEELAPVNPKQIQQKLHLYSEFDKAQFFEKHRSALIQRVKNVKSIADKLREQRIIHEELYSEITYTNLTCQDSMRKICSTLHSSGVIAKGKFIVILLEEEPHLFEELVRSDS